MRLTFSTPIGVFAYYKLTLELQDATAEIGGMVKSLHLEIAKVNESLNARIDKLENKPDA